MCTGPVRPDDDQGDPAGRLDQGASCVHPGGSPLRPGADDAVTFCRSATRPLLHRHLRRRPSWNRRTPSRARFAAQVRRPGAAGGRHRRRWTDLDVRRAPLPKLVQVQRRWAGRCRSTGSRANPLRRDASRLGHPRPGGDMDLNGVYASLNFPSFLLATALPATTQQVTPRPAIWRWHGAESPGTAGTSRPVGAYRIASSRASCHCAGSRGRREDDLRERRTRIPAR